MQHSRPSRKAHMWPRALLRLNYHWPEYCGRVSTHQCCLPTRMRCSRAEADTSNTASRKNSSSESSHTPHTHTHPGGAASRRASLPYIPPEHQKNASTSKPIVDTLRRPFLSSSLSAIAHNTQPSRSPAGLASAVFGIQNFNSVAKREPLNLLFSLINDLTVSLNRKIIYGLEATVIFQRPLSAAVHFRSLPHTPPTTLRSTRQVRLTHPSCVSCNALM